MAKRKCYMIGSLIIVLLVCFLNQDSKNVHALQKGISSQVIRFHVLANSDSEEDQEMKLKVRDGVVAFVQKKLKKAESKDEAEKIIQKNLSKIKREANKILKEENYESRAVAKLTREEFPVKVYGDTVFPAGEYETLQVEIGKAKGHNWWCVMYPSLCLVDESVAVVPEESKVKLRDSLTEEEYETITQEKLAVKYRFKIAELWDNLWN